MLLHSLQQGLGLACRVVGTEVLVFLHFLLQREQLTLEFAAQTRQRVPDVVGQLLETEQTQLRDKEGGADVVSLAEAGRQQTWFRAFCRCGVPMRSAMCL